MHQLHRTVKHIARTCTGQWLVRLLHGRERGEQLHSLEAADRSLRPVRVGIVLGSERVLCAVQFRIEQIADDYTGLGKRDRVLSADFG